MGPAMGFVWVACKCSRAARRHREPAASVSWLAGWQPHQPPGTTHRPSGSVRYATGSLPAFSRNCRSTVPFLQTAWAGRCEARR